MFVGARSDARAVVAAALVSAILVAIALISYKHFARPMLIVVVAVALSPWLFGLTANLMHGWQQVIHWGSRYEALHDSLASSVPPPPTITTAELVAGSTWLPVPWLAWGDDGLPLALLTRAPDGRKVSYGLLDIP